MSKRMELRRKKKAKTVRRVAAQAFRPHQFQAKEARIREARNWRLALALTGQDLTIHQAIEGRTALIRRRRLQLGCNSCFVATGINRNMLLLTGDVAERLKAAVC
jgi:hypothetical protein